MKKLLVVLASILLFYILYIFNINNIYSLMVIMLTHFNGVPSPTWIIMNTSYLYGPYITIPIMSVLWFINSTLFFYYWRWVIYYRKGKDMSNDYIEYLYNKPTMLNRLLLKMLSTDTKWYHVALFRLIPIPFGTSVVFCATLKGISSFNYMLGNAIAVLLTTIYFSFAINLIKLSEIPAAIKAILYIIHML